MLANARQKLAQQVVEGERGKRRIGDGAERADARGGRVRAIVGVEPLAMQPRSASMRDRAGHRRQHERTELGRNR
jgi:hypothetical protein